MQVRPSTLLIGLLLTGCATSLQHQEFLHQGHRERYAVGESEWKDLEFLISKQVLLRDPAAEDGRDKVSIVEENTRGRVTGNGENWLAIRFSTGLQLLFVTDPDRVEDVYWLADRDLATGEVQKLCERSDKTLLLDGRRFTVTQGERAILLVDSADWRNLRDERDHVPVASP